jgi:hypothetical protein
VGHVHAKDIRQGSGSFKQWPYERRSRLLRELLDSLAEGSDYCLVVDLNNHEFDNHYRSPDKNERRRRGVVDSKYGVCFRVFINLITQIVEQRSPGECFTITLETGHQNRGAAETIFAEFIKYAPEQARLITSVLYVDKAQAIGVQAADLIAYVYFRGFNDSLLEGSVEFRLPHVRAQNPPNVPTPTPNLISTYNAAITQEMLEEIRQGQITRAQRERWLRGVEGR